MPTPGKNFDGQKGYPTPDGTPEIVACRLFRVPASDEWLGVLMAALSPLASAYNWYRWGELTPDEAADAWNDIIIRAYEDSFVDACPSPLPTPFWDEAVDVDDEADVETQTWYGYVTDLDNPTTTFVEDAAVWTFAGFLALAGAPAAAIAFATVAPKFIVAIRRGNLGEIVKLYLDGEEAAVVDTSGYTEGDVIYQPIVASGTPPYNLMLVQVE